MSRYISLFVDFDQCHVRTNLKVRENSVFVDVFSGDSCAIRKKTGRYEFRISFYVILKKPSCSTSKTLSAISLPIKNYSIKSYLEYHFKFMGARDL